ncbi:MAG TPA: DUF4173 domain-containing protein [Phycisphaerales bacterium]|nr:DUF4173 domain-containing protein [Phycisphaerales bacterium]
MSQISSGALGSSAVEAQVDASDYRPSLRKFLRSMVGVATLSAMLVAAADYLFYRQRIGWTLGLFGLLVLAAMIVRRNHRLKSRAMVSALTATAVMCGLLIVQPGALRIVLALFGVLTVSALSSRGWTAHASGWVTRWVELAGRCVIQVELDIVNRLKWAQKHNAKKVNFTKLALNWGLPVVLSVVFLMIFAAANPVIGQWWDSAVNRVMNVLMHITDYVAVGRVVLWMVVGMCAYSLLRGRLRARDMRMLQEAGGEAVLGRVISDGLLVRCLLAFNLVFLIQNSLDVMTLITNGTQLPDGMDFRTYARRGAYPLVATALLAAGFVLLTFRSGERSGQLSGAEKWSRRLVYLWIAQNVLLTAMAMWRLTMYVEALGLTRLRISAGVWMALVAIGLVSIVWRIAAHCSNAWLVRVNAVSLTVVLFGCAWVNWDKMMASYDLHNCQEMNGPGPRIDLAFMRSLGPESIPALRELEKNANNSAVRTCAGSYAFSLEDELQQDLGSWRGWTLRRAEIADEIGLVMGSQ